MIAQLSRTAARNEQRIRYSVLVMVTLRGWPTGGIQPGSEHLTGIIAFRKFPSSIDGRLVVENGQIVSDEDSSRWLDRVASIVAAIDLISIRVGYCPVNRTRPFNASICSPTPISIRLLLLAVTSHLRSEPATLQVNGRKNPIDRAIQGRGLAADPGQLGFPFDFDVPTVTHRRKRLHGLLRIPGITTFWGRQTAGFTSP